MIKVVPKVWGFEQWIVNDDAYCGKRLILQKGMQCSLHRHPVKRETFFVQSGFVRLEAGGLVMMLRPGDSMTIEPGTWHRFAGLRDSVIFEFSTRHDDADVERAAGEESRTMSGPVAEAWDGRQ